MGDSQIRHRSGRNAAATGQGAHDIEHRPEDGGAVCRAHLLAEIRGQAEKRLVGQRRRARQ